MWRWGALIWLAVLIVGVEHAYAQPPRIAIVIDDVGYRWREDSRAMALPQQVAVAVIPDSPHGSEMASLASTQQREVLLHLSMQALGDSTRHASHAHLHLTTADTTSKTIRTVLDEALQRIPTASGVSNHRGSALTQQREAMRRLMQELARSRELYFLDSYTTADSIALSEAWRANIPATRRDVFLDHDRSPTAIEYQIERLIRIARHRGQALAIGHPWPETLTQIERLLPRLAAEGIELVSPATLMRVGSVRPDASAD
ncbi:MAG: divergent polysaccharide deacetylase family protein [Pseudomonadota bacterium]